MNNFVIQLLFVLCFLLVSILSVLTVFTKGFEQKFYVVLSIIMTLLIMNMLFTYLS